MSANQIIPDATLPEGILYRGEEITFYGESITAEIHDLNQEPVLRVKENNSVEYIIPARAASLLNKQYKRELQRRNQYYNKTDYDENLSRRGSVELMVNKLYSKLEELRFNLHNPINLPNVEALDKSNSKTLTLKKYNEAPNVKVHPVLVWSAIQTNRQDEYSKKYLWKLILLEAPNTTLGEAAWNDEEGIKHLVDGLDNIDTLKITFALTNPIGAMEYSSKEEFTTYSEREDFPKSSRGELATLLTDLLTPNNYRDKLNMHLLPIMVCNVPIAILIRVEGSDKVKRKAEYLNRSSDGLINKMKHKMKSNAEYHNHSLSPEEESKVFTSSVKDAVKTWMEASRTLIQEPNSGWRIVELQNILSSDNSYIVTKIPEDVWESDIIQKVIKFAHRSNSKSYSDEDWMVG